MSDMTLINLNMLYIRFGKDVERECHTPLGCLYLTGALEKAGYTVDFRDYQTAKLEDPFQLEAFMNFVSDPGEVIGLSCMANLLPFTLIAAKRLKRRYPDRKIVLGGVGTRDVENRILSRFDWIDVICRGEGENTGPELLNALLTNASLSEVRGISYRDKNGVHHTADRERISDLDGISLPAYSKVNLHDYSGYGIMSSRGCPYPCTFCSVAPVWDNQTRCRSADNIVKEMVMLNQECGVDLFLFQDEFFVSTKKQVVEFCNRLLAAGMGVSWKAFGRVNLLDREMMELMAHAGMYRASVRY